MPSATAETFDWAAELEPFRATATQRQREIIDALIACGSVPAAAKRLGIAERNVYYALARIRRNNGATSRKSDIAKHAYWSRIPGGNGVHPDAPDYGVRAMSTLYDADGNMRLNWVKTTRDHDAIAQREAARAFADELPRAEPALPPAHTDGDLATCYVLTDYHLGMLAWHEEAGEDWDLHIAEDLLVRWFASAIASTPPSRLGIFAQLGDFLHWDGLEALTPASKHPLDADTRFQKLVRVAIRSVRRIVQMLLAKHDRLVVIMADANHDPASSVWLREGFAAHFEDEPRVTVDLRADGYYCVEHGRTSLFFHHGHRRKIADIESVFVAKFRSVFGRTKYSYGHIGHLHNSEVRESPLMIVERHRTLAAKDAYASRHGFMSGRSASAITYHVEHGEVGRVTITPEAATS
jgi:hypothetical protein